MGHPSILAVCQLPTLSKDVLLHGMLGIWGNLGELNPTQLRILVAYWGFQEKDGASSQVQHSMVNSQVNMLVSTRLIAL